MKLNFSRWGNDLYTGKRSYDFVGKRWIWFGISIVAVLVCGILLVKPGLNPGIEFAGGTDFQVSAVAHNDQAPAEDAVRQVTNKIPRVSSVGGNGIRVQTEELTAEQSDKVKQLLAKAYDVSPDNVSSSRIGPTWGKEVQNKAFQGAGIFMIFAMLLMSVYFRAWRMALAAIVALLHDLVLTVGIYAAVGWEVTPATVIGFLTILGYSIYDTVVVFDKVRENTTGVLDQTRYTYAEAANLAVNQTLVRSINTSVVALLPVTALLVWSAVDTGTLRDIALSLFVGMAVGTLSSIFVATPLEVMLREHEKNIKAHTKKVLAKRAAASDEDAQPERIHSLGATKPGSHQGQSAQPRRRNKSER